MAVGCPGAARIYRHLYYVKNKDREMRLAREWERVNPDRVEGYKRRRQIEYFGRSDVKAAMAARSAQWAIVNKTKVLAASERYRVRNRSLYASYAAKRRSRKANATPAWLTQEHWDQIHAFYVEAERLTRDTGVKHEVDHIVPLHGGTVCGLHVPWNLRVIPMEQNRSRPRIWREQPG